MREGLDLEDDLVIPLVLPSSHHFQSCFSAGRLITFDALVGCFLRKQVVPFPTIHDTSAAYITIETDVDPISTRLKSHTKRTAAAAFGSEVKASIVVTRPESTVLSPCPAAPMEPRPNIAMLSPTAKFPPQLRRAHRSHLPP